MTSRFTPVTGRGPVLLFVLLAALAVLAGCSQPDTGSPDGSSGTAAATIFRFSAIPDQNSTEVQEKLAPLVEHLSTKLGVQIEYVPARDYQAAVEMFKNGDVHLAWFGGLTGVQARQAVPGAKAIAQGASDPQFYSYLIAHRDTGLERSEDFPAEGLAPLTFAFGSESSTSGRLMPEYYIRQETNQGPEEFFAEPVVFSGSHDRTVELVESGQVQAGAVNYKVYDRRVVEGETDPDVVRVIWQTPFYADYNWTVRPDVDAQFGEGFTQRLQDTLLAIYDPTLLAALPREKLIAADNDDFSAIEEVAKSLNMLR